VRILRNSLVAILTVAVIMALSTTVPAQAGPGQSTERPRYDTKTETTISGVVQEVKEVVGAGQSRGIHLFVKTSDAVVEVHVGPSWYLEQQKYVFTKGDQVKVTGCKAKISDNDVILAREITKGENTWTLRDAQGIPRWSRGKRGQ